MGKRQSYSGRVYRSTAALPTAIVAGRHADHIDVRQSCLPSESAASALRTGRHP